MFFENKNSVINKVIEPKKGKLSNKQLLLGLIALIVVFILVMTWIFSDDEPKKSVTQTQNNNAVAVQSTYQAPPLPTAQNTIADEEALKRVRENKANKEAQKEPKQAENEVKFLQENNTSDETSINSNEIAMPQINSEQITGDIKNAIKEAFDELKVAEQISNLREEIKPEIKEQKVETAMKDFLLAKQPNFKIKNNSLLYENKIHYIGDFIGGYEIIDIGKNFVVFYDKNENWNYKLNFKDEK